MKATYWLPSCLVAPWLRIGYLYNGSLAAMLLPGLPVGLPSCFRAPYISVVAPLLPSVSVFQSVSDMRYRLKFADVSVAPNFK